MRHAITHSSLYPKESCEFEFPNEEIDVTHSELPGLLSLPKGESPGKKVKGSSKIVSRKCAEVHRVVSTEPRGRLTGRFPQDPGPAQAIEWSPQRTSRGRTRGLPLSPVLSFVLSVCGGTRGERSSANSTRILGEEGVET